MAVIKEHFNFKSTVGDLDIHGISWKPEDGQIKAVLQLVHGMAEYIDRYDEMARYMAERGIAVYGSDHIGHGESINDKYHLGYFGDENKEGRIFISDVKKLTDIAKKENPEVPYILFGHSMGSFVARGYSAVYGDQLDGVIFCGTGGPGKEAIPFLSVMSGILKTGNGKNEAQLMDKLCFGSYNKKTEGRTKFDWLSVNEKNVDKYIDDPLCGFVFSKRGFRDLVSLLKFVTKSSAFESVPKDLPILLIAGDEDPVGDYGNGVKKVHEKFKSTGHDKAEIHLIHGARHEIHNEEDREEMYERVYLFIKNII